MSQLLVCLPIRVLHFTATSQVPAHRDTPFHNKFDNREMINLNVGAQICSEIQFLVSQRGREREITLVNSSDAIALSNIALSHSFRLIRGNSKSFLKLIHDAHEVLRYRWTRNFGVASEQEQSCYF